jgi:hypothetical protein
VTVASDGVAVSTVAVSGRPIAPGAFRGARVESQADGEISLARGPQRSQQVNERIAARRAVPDRLLSAAVQSVSRTSLRS